MRQKSVKGLVALRIAKGIITLGILLFFQRFQNAMLLQRLRIFLKH